MSSGRGWTLGVASALLAGALALAPPVIRHHAARSGMEKNGREHSTTARALRGLPLPEEEDGAPPLLPSARPEPSRRAAPGLEREAEAEAAPLGLAPDGERAEELDDDPPPPLAPVPDSLPAWNTPGRTATSAPVPAVDEPEAQPALVDEPAADDAPAADEASEPVATRRVSIVTLEARTQPGLCRGSNDALDARALLIERFHALSWDGASTLYLDPRLPSGVDATLVADLEQAEREISRVLQLAPRRPDVFAYLDTRLLLAGGCTNDNVVAYYDGALHVVPSHADVAQSVLHEYTHHALTSAGLLGPAWAQEGIAMHLASETWWQEGWMARVAERPFSLEAMEDAVPYTLSPDQAGLFYAQSAAMVECAIRDDPAGLRGLVESLAAGHERGELSYRLPAAAAPAAWRSCFADLAR